MKITDLKPEIVWKFFHQVTQVPRPSKKEGKMIEFLESFAKQYKIAIKKDAVGNILMSKPATPGKENLPTVVLQSHMDMVCEKNNGTAHDFDHDPIETIVDGNWLRANGTTLGAELRMSSRHLPLVSPFGPVTRFHFTRVTEKLTPEAFSP